MVTLSDESNSLTDPFLSLRFCECKNVCGTCLDGGGHSRAMLSDVLESTAATGEDRLAETLRVLGGEFISESDSSSSCISFGRSLNTSGSTFGGNRPVTVLFVSSSVDHTALQDTF